MAGNLRQYPVSDFLRSIGLHSQSLTTKQPDSPHSRALSEDAADMLLPYPPSISLLDVRSPSEFIRGHIPGAVNLPLFNDAERTDVGIIYKQQGKDEALLLGLGMVGPRMESMARRLTALAGIKKEVALYCSRGGMRSASVGWLCSTLGIRCSVLKGGYKAFRRYVLAGFDTSCRLVVLGGKTGSGKTEVLHCLARRGEQVLDLEGMAHHRGSAFGALQNIPQPSSEHFENRLAVALGQCDPNRPIWVEDECENLGQVNVPRSFFSRLRDAGVIVLEASTQSRLNRVLVEYGNISPEVMGGSLDRIKKRLGGLEHKRAHECLAENNLSGLATILLNYYDRAYSRQLGGRPVLHILAEDNPDKAAVEIMSLCAHTMQYMVCCSDALRSYPGQCTCKD